MPPPCSLFKKSGGGDVSKTYKWKKETDLLGTGNFAEVFKASLQQEGRTANIAGVEVAIPSAVAIKVIDKSKVEDMNDITREIDIMKKVNHKNIIKLYEIFDESKKMNLVMELVTGGELFDRIVERGNYTEKDAANTIYTLCNALDHLHKMNIVHRDLKPENILYASSDPDAEIKVADFGLARVADGS